eukprot:12068533-Alexandrium_andersonii.AAC.1
MLLHSQSGLTPTPQATGGSLPGHRKRPASSSAREQQGFVFLLGSFAGRGNVGVALRDRS